MSAKKIIPEKKNIDKRIIKTKQAIRSAFIDLVQQKSISEISISELTKKASITRSTFYMYYDSIDDVRDAIEDELLKGLERFLKDSNVSQVMVSPYPFLRTLSDKIMSYDEMNNYIVCGKDSGNLMEKIKHTMAETIMQNVSKYIDTNDKNIYSSAFYMVTFVCSGVVDCYISWFNNKDSLTLENLCENIAEIVILNKEFVENKLKRTTKF